MKWISLIEWLIGVGGDERSMGGRIGVGRLEGWTREDRMEKAKTFPKSGEPWRQPVR